MGYDTGLRPGDIPESHREFFRAQKLYYIDEQNNCFVHAGFDRRRPFTGQELEQYIWDRELWNEALTWMVNKKIHHDDSDFEMVTQFNSIFIGHTPTLNWKFDKPMKAANIYNLDTGAGHFGRLTIMEVETKKYWQSDLVESLYERRAEQYTC
jgi:serine/threonine protein phosphatase 1